MGGHAFGVCDNVTLQPDSAHLYRSRKLPWYSAEIEEITPQAQELFEKYSDVEPGKVKAHIKELVRSKVPMKWLHADIPQRDKAYVVVSRYQVCYLVESLTC